MQARAGAGCREEDVRGRGQGLWGRLLAGGKGRKTRAGKGGMQGGRRARAGVGLVGHVLTGGMQGRKTHAGGGGMQGGRRARAGAR